MAGRRFSLRELLQAVGLAAIYFAMMGVGIRNAEPAAAIAILAAGHAPIGLAAVLHYCQRRWALRKAAPRYLELPMHCPRGFSASFGVILLACVVLVVLGRLPAIVLLAATPWTIGAYILFLPDRFAALCSGGVVFMSHMFSWDCVHPLRNANGELEFLRIGKMRGAWRAIVAPTMRDPVEAILRVHAVQTTNGDVKELSSVPIGLV